MAVTQQLARVSAEYLAGCERSARESPDGDARWDPPSSDCLDLDWAPAMLERAAALAGLDRPLLDALARATEGDESVDLWFLNTFPHDISPFGPPAAALPAAEVARVAGLLARIDPGRLVDGLPVDREEAGALIGLGAAGILGDLRAYLRGHFADLCRFYAEAAGRGLSVVLWWD